MMCRVLVVVLSYTIPLAAQSWDALRSLRPGDSVKVLDTSSRLQKGSFKAVSENAISLATPNGEVAIPRTRVRRVELKSPSRRVRNVAIGVAIGLALGLVVDQTLGTYLRNESGESDGTRALTYIVPIGLFGGIGAAAAGYRTVYRAR